MNQNYEVKTGPTGSLCTKKTQMQYTAIFRSQGNDSNGKILMLKQSNMNVINFNMSNRKYILSVLTILSYCISHCIVFFF